MGGRGVPWGVVRGKQVGVFSGFSGPSSVRFEGGVVRRWRREVGRVRFWEGARRDGGEEGWASKGGREEKRVRASVVRWAMEGCMATGCKAEAS